jgi:xylose dehydrogenase (NAD/NADP)
MSPVRWGILGAGWISRRAIAPAIHSASGASLEAVGARDEARARALSPRTAAYTDYAAVIEDPHIDAVYIALSNDGHLPWAEAALAAGKAVLCEKPLGRNAEEARRMRAAAQAVDGLLVEATWNLWHPRTGRAAALLASDAIGRLSGVTGAFVFDGVDEGNYRLDPLRGGGALLDVGCYPLTGAAWATGATAITVEECEVTRAPSGVDLTTVASVRFGDVPVRMRASFIETAYEALLLEGEHGVIEFTGSDAFTSWLRPSSLRVLDRDGERVEHFPPVDPYRLMIEHVTAAVAGHDAWLPDPLWSLTVAEAMDAIGNRG